MLVAVAALRSTETSDLPSDGDLIHRTLAGDEEAYAVLVERYQKRIYRIAFAILRNDMEADIVTQDTFVQAYLHLKKFEGRSELETWLTRITINRARDCLRRRRWLPLPGGEDEDHKQSPEPVDARPDAESQTAARELLQAIERAAATLSARQRTIFRLRHYEEMSLERIAELMGLRPGTVRSHLFRAVHKIRKELEAWTPAGRISREHER
jgi:RNA polymerase sigma-70 factor (ECF subfamily)